MKIRTYIGIMAAMVLFVFGAAFGDTPRAAGEISKVIVYRGQALVTRVIEVELPDGVSEFIVTGLPERVLSESLYGQAADGMKVLSVRYREKDIKEDMREEVKALDAQIEEVNKELYRVTRDRDHAQSRWEAYQPFWKLTLDGTVSDLNRGLLQAGPVIELTDDLEAKAIKWHDECVRLEETKADLKKQLEELNRKRAELDKGRSRKEREAIVFVSSSGQKVKVELSYLVNGANWLPQYNLRADTDASKVLIEYNAVVNQTSGEDWVGAVLSLSTAERTMVAAAPVLETMEIKLGTRGRRGRVSEAKAPAQRAEMQQSAYAYRDMGAEFERLMQSRAGSIKGGKLSQRRLNDVAISNQMLEFFASNEDLQAFRTKAEKLARLEGVSVSYELEGELTLLSRTDQQLVNIATIEANAEFVLVGMPLLTDYVYRQAEVLNDSDKVLLPGPASMYRDGTFVGKDEMRLVTIGEKFVTGFGVDSQIQIAREVKDKKSETLWGSRVETYDYRITMSNFKDKAAKLRLLDRLPFTEDERLKIEDLETDTPLSEDAEYVQGSKKKGILRWDLELEADSTGPKAKVVTYKYTMKYDKALEIEPVASDK